MKWLRILFSIFLVMLISCTPNLQTIAPAKTSNPQPTGTYTITKSFNTVTAITPSPSALPNPNPTEMFVASLCSPSPRIDNNELSPDGQWLAISCEDLNAADEANAPYVKIVKLDKSAEWTVTLKQITGFNYIGYNGGGGWFPGILNIHHWYKDSRFIFLVPNYVIDGVNADGWGLYRFDTATGKISAYLPVGSTVYSFGFSHDDEYYAYHYAQENHIIHLVSLETDENTISQVPGNSETIHNFLWSPDNNIIAFEAEDTKTDYQQTTLFLFDIKTKVFTNLLVYDLYKYTPIGWNSKTQLVLRGYENDVVEYNLDINTGELTNK